MSCVLMNTFSTYMVVQKDVSIVLSLSFHM